MTAWLTIEELAAEAFGVAPVVMANEAHDGMRRCVRTRRVGVRLVRAAHELGVRDLAMEALPAPAPGAPRAWTRRHVVTDWAPMGYQYVQATGRRPHVVDQTVTVNWNNVASYLPTALWSGSRASSRPMEEGPPSCTTTHRSSCSATTRTPSSSRPTTSWRSDLATPTLSVRSRALRRRSRPTAGPRRRPRGRPAPRRASRSRTGRRARHRARRGTPPTFGAGRPGTRTRRCRR
jgi:hypothetical protein